MNRFDPFYAVMDEIEQKLNHAHEVSGCMFRGVVVVPFRWRPLMEGHMLGESMNNQLQAFGIDLVFDEDADFIELKPELTTYHYEVMSPHGMEVIDLYVVTRTDTGEVVKVFPDELADRVINPHHYLGPPLLTPQHTGVRT